MTQLPLDERETIITFDEEGKDAIIFTYNKTWQKHLEQRMQVKGDPNGYGGKTYIIPKARLRLPQPPKNLTPEQRRKIGERLSKGRQQKPSG